MDQRIPIVSFRDRPLLIPWWVVEVIANLTLALSLHQRLGRIL
jgi:hypothetical protein